MTLREALNGFVSECNQDERLRQMNRDWSRTIRIVAVGGSDSEEYWLHSDRGFISADQEAVAEADMEIRGDSNTLVAIFSGERTPTEPYNAGDLMVKGTQDDLMRLDILCLLIWGE